MPCTKVPLNINMRLYSYIFHCYLMFFNVSADEFGILQEFQLEFLWKSGNLKIFSPILDNLMKYFLAKEILRGVM